MAHAPEWMDHRNTDTCAVQCNDLEGMYGNLVPDHDLHNVALVFLSQTSFCRNPSLAQYRTLVTEVGEAVAIYA